MSEAKQKILIADDDEDLVRIIRMRLDAEGFETHGAYEGNSAVEIIHKVMPDLIILDLKMPTSAGQSVLLNIKSRFETQKIPVIVLSGLDDPVTKDQVLKDGAQMFIKKPCEIGELVRRIRSVLE